MKAVRFYGKGDVRVETVPDPAILNPRDAVVKITATAICGSDLHITLDDAPEMYRTFREKQDGCIKVVMKPAA